MTPTTAPTTAPAPIAGASARHTLTFPVPPCARWDDVEAVLTSVLEHYTGWTRDECTLYVASYDAPARVELERNADGLWVGTATVTV